MPQDFRSAKIDLNENSPPKGSPRKLPSEISTGKFLSKVSPRKFPSDPSKTPYSIFGGEF
jgi:hypothetical protein